ncbi:hypothetical protein Goe16_01800 [Bacillus phage vB_BsuM-Goe16]|nr:hypothetical protein Goe16_01800 [Bacillus phage vB_BsuM-Goe16]
MLEAFVICLGFTGMVLVYSGVMSFIIGHYLKVKKLSKRVATNIMVTGGIMFWIAFIITMTTR